jgi:hypothetical protein
MSGAQYTRVVRRFPKMFLEGKHPMTTSEIDPFDAYGGIRRDFSEAEIETLSDDVRPKFFELVRCATECEEAEAQLKTDTDAMHAAVDVARVARETLEKVTPKITFLEALRAVQNRPKEY